MKKLSRITACLVALCALIQTAKAHFIWIELGQDNQPRVCFGEFGENLREKSGGRLDDIKGLEAWITFRGAKVADTLEKREQGFDLYYNGPRYADQVAQATGVEVKDWTKHKLGIVKPIYYARMHVPGNGAPAKPELTLDILPKDRNTGSFAVFFRQKPLADVDVMLHTPGQKEPKKYKTNAQGVVTLGKWTGAEWLLEVIYPEKTPGEFEGKKYEAVRHRATCHVAVVTMKN